MVKGAERNYGEKPPCLEPHICFFLQLAASLLEASAVNRRTKTSQVIIKSSIHENLSSHRLSNWIFLMIKDDFCF